MNNVLAEAGENISSAVPANFKNLTIDLKQKSRGLIFYIYGA